MALNRTLHCSRSDIDDTDSNGGTGTNSSSPEFICSDVTKFELRTLSVSPIPVSIAKQIVIRNHYLHSFPGGTQLCFGVFSENRLTGALTFGVGPTNAHRLVNDAEPRECLTLSRLWLNDDLPKNSESRVIGLTLRAIRSHTDVKFVLSYADPAQGHRGTIYQAANWVYTGLSEAIPLYDIGDGIPRHSRTFSHAIGSHSKRYLADNGITVREIPQSAKHRYVYFIEKRWRTRLCVPELPYPKKEVSDESD